MKKKHYRLLPYITIILVVMIFIFLCNFYLCTYYINPSEYRLEEVKVVKHGFDGLFSTVPKITVSYSYKGVDYESFFFDYNMWLFNHKEIGDSCNVYVNVKSPPSIIYVRDFWDSYVNIGFVIVIGVNITIIVVNIIRSIVQYVKRRKIRRERRKARKEEKAKNKLEESNN